MLLGAMKDHRSTETMNRDREPRSENELDVRLEVVSVLSLPGKSVS